MTASRFEQRFEAHAIPALEREFSVQVTLHRGALATTAFCARRNERLTEVMGSEIGISARIDVREYLLPVSDVVIGGQTLSPQPGDKIHDGEEWWQIFYPDDGTMAVKRETGEHDWIVQVQLIEADYGGPCCSNN